MSQIFQTQREDKRRFAMKMFRALTDSVCEKHFGSELLPGWFATTKEALSAYEQPTAADTATEDAGIPAPKKRGRPAKVN